MTYSFCFEEEEEVLRNFNKLYQEFFLCMNLTKDVKHINESKVTILLYRLSDNENIYQMRIFASNEWIWKYSDDVSQIIPNLK